MIISCARPRISGVTVGPSSAGQAVCTASKRGRRRDYGFGALGRWFYLYLCAMLALFSAGPVEAQSLKTSGTVQKNVYVGIYINKIDDINLKNNEFAVDFYVWFRWDDASITPIDDFELANGEITSRTNIHKRDIGGMHYACCRVHGIIHKFWEISTFPLDDHTITIEIESVSNEEFKQIYIADEVNSGMRSDAQVAGWSLTPGRAVVTSHRYNTNYGDVSLPTGKSSVYSTLVYSVKMSRTGNALFLKMFSGLFVSVGIALLSIWIRPIDLDPRFGLGIGAMFAAIASEYVAMSSLPDTHQMTLVDKLHILSFCYIFATLIESTVSLRVWNSGREHQSKWLDRIAFPVLTMSYWLLVARIVLQ